MHLSSASPPHLTDPGRARDYAPAGRDTASSRGQVRLRSSRRGRRGRPKRGRATASAGGRDAGRRAARRHRGRAGARLPEVLLMVTTSPSCSSCPDQHLYLMLRAHLPDQDLLDIHSEAKFCHDGQKYDVADKKVQKGKRSIIPAGDTSQFK